jgi:hypothetical protein
MDDDDADPTAALVRRVALELGAILLGAGLLGGLLLLIPA